MLLAGTLLPELDQFPALFQLPVAGVLTVPPAPVQVQVVASARLAKCAEPVAATAAARIQVLAFLRVREAYISPPNLRRQKPCPANRCITNWLNSTSPDVQRGL